MDDAAFHMHLRRWGAYGLYLAGLVNLAAILVMGLVLRGALLGDVPARLAYIVAHRGAVELSWAVWMGATLSLLLSLVILAPVLDPRGRHLLRFALVVAVVGAASDIGSDLMNMTAIPALAAEYLAGTAALHPMILLDYRVWNGVIRGLTGGVGNTSYVLAGFMYVYVMSRTVEVPRWLVGWGAMVWSAAALASISLIWAPRFLPPTVAATIILYALWVWGLGWFCLWRQPREQ